MTKETNGQYIQKKTDDLTQGSEVNNTINQNHPSKVKHWLLNNFSENKFTYSQFY